MKRSAIAALLALAALSPAVASGAPPDAAGREVRGSVTSGTAHLGTSRGYEVDLVVPGDGATVLSVHRVTQQELGGTAGTRYAVRPATTLASGMLRAEFGAIGTVALRFEPNGMTRTGRVPRGCKGRPPRSEQGTYRGRVELRGEGGWFAVNRVSVPGTRHRSFRLLCGAGSAPRAAAAPSLAALVEPNFSNPLAEVEARLEVLAEKDGRVLAYRAEEPRHNVHSIFREGAFEWQGTMAVGRSSHTLATGGFGTSAPGVQPATAEARGLGTSSAAGLVTPTYALDLGWTAPLHFGLPGLGVALAGSEAQTHLCIGSASESAIPCPTSGPPLLIPKHLGGPADPVPNDPVSAA